MTLNTWIGIGASTFTSLALIPQLVKLIREQKAGDLSVAMLAILFTGLALWIYYGVLQKDWIIIISNSVALLINLATGLLTVWLNAKKKSGNARRNVPRKSRQERPSAESGD